MKKQEKCQIFAADAGVPISDELMVTTGSKHALSSGNMTLNWREWKRRPAIEHTWANWKLHWTAAFAEMRDITRMTTGTQLSAPTKPQKWNKHNKWPRHSTTLPTRPSRRTPPSKTSLQQMPRSPDPSRTSNASSPR
jgi:hypothetical protein